MLCVSDVPALVRWAAAGGRTQLEEVRLRALQQLACRLVFSADNDTQTVNSLHALQCSLTKEDMALLLAALLGAAAARAANTSAVPGWKELEGKHSALQRLQEEEDEEGEGERQPQQGEQTQQPAVTGSRKRGREEGSGRWQ